MKEYQKVNVYKSLKEIDRGRRVVRREAEKLDDLIYYVFHEEDDLRLRLYVLKRLQTLVLEQCYEKTGYVGTGKTFDLLNRKYY